MHISSGKFPGMKYLFRIFIFLSFMSSIHGQKDGVVINAHFILGQSDNFEVTPDYKDSDFPYFNSSTDEIGNHVGFRAGVSRPIKGPFSWHCNLMFRWHSNGLYIVLPEEEVPFFDNPREDFLYYNSDFTSDRFYNHYAFELGLSYSLDMSWVTLSTDFGISMGYLFWDILELQNAYDIPPRQLVYTIVYSQRKFSFDPYIGFIINKSISEKIGIHTGIRMVQSFTEIYEGEYFLDLNSGVYKGELSTTASRLDFSFGVSYSLAN